MTPSIKDLGLAQPEVVALKALAAGNADAAQQRLAIAAIRQKICIEAESAFSTSPDVTAFNEGRRFVGISIRRALAAPVADFPEVDHG